MRYVFSPLSCACEMYKTRDVRVTVSIKLAPDHIAYDDIIHVGTEMNIRAEKSAIKSGIERAIRILYNSLRIVQTVLSTASKLNEQTRLRRP